MPVGREVQTFDRDDLGTKHGEVHLPGFTFLQRRIAIDVGRGKVGRWMLADTAGRTWCQVAASRGDIRTLPRILEERTLHQKSMQSRDHARLHFAKGRKTVEWLLSHLHLELDGQQPKLCNLLLRKHFHSL